jgi:hypothetical protein
VPEVTLEPDVPLTVKSLALAPPAKIQPLLFAVTSTFQLCRIKTKQDILLPVSVVIGTLYGVVLGPFLVKIKLSDIADAAVVAGTKILPLAALTVVLLAKLIATVSPFVKGFDLSKDTIPTGCLNLIYGILISE